MELNENTASVQPNVPLMTQERFSQLSGLSEESIRGMIHKGHLPSMKVGRRRLVNVALLSAQCLDAEDWT
ncbi:DNA-binding protein [Kushneria sp. Sum13]|uniref:DNA-binding protein n=1 Tax=Kushneria sp. Sum13 TaxID=3459196 RepID=UPI0040468433